MLVNAHDKNIVPYNYDAIAMFSYNIMLVS